MSERTMEEIREVALTYYECSPAKVQEAANKIFNSMDRDGNGRISLEEFQAHDKNEKIYVCGPSLFAKLDANGDGLLDFDEIKVFFYMVQFRNLFCRGCMQHLHSVYFTCLKCFAKKKKGKSFDLCVNCYQNTNYNHKHKEFLDNFALLTALPKNEDSLFGLLGASNRVYTFGKHIVDFADTSLTVCSIM